MNKCPLSLGCKPSAVYSSPLSVTGLGIPFLYKYSEILMNTIRRNSISVFTRVMNLVRNLKTNDKESIRENRSFKFTNYRENWKHFTLYLPLNETSQNEIYFLINQFSCYFIKNPGSETRVETNRAT